MTTWAAQVAKNRECLRCHAKPGTVCRYTGDAVRFDHHGRPYRVFAGEPMVRFHRQRYVRPTPPEPGHEQRYARSPGRKK